MYGTVARLRLKAGMEAELERQLREFGAQRVPGFIGTYVYRTDADPAEGYMVAIFESKDAYEANARSPEQDARYRQMLTLLEGEPEWHDGQIIGALTQPS